MSKELEETVKDLQKRIENLERKDVPWITPYTPPYKPMPDDIIEDIKASRCSKCHLELGKIMGYVCSQPNCPTGMCSPMCNV